MCVIHGSMLYTAEYGTHFHLFSFGSLPFKSLSMHWPSQMCLHKLNSVGRPSGGRMSFWMQHCRGDTFNPFCSLQVDYTGRFDTVPWC